MSSKKRSSKKILIGIVGMPGAGKTTAIDMILDLGASVVAMGDVIREEAKSRDLELTRKNLSNIMFSLREKEGPMVVAQRCIPKIDKAEEDIVIIDGLRSLEEVEFFKEIYSNFEVILIHAKEKIRFEYPMIDITGNTAMVKIHYIRGDKHIYTDYLLLLKFSEGWRITDKIYFTH